jgi:general stress protein 26
MPTAEKLEEQFWASLKSDMTMMLGLVGVDESHARPMTAQLDGEAHSAIYFFTARDTGIVQALGGRESRAVATYAARGHELFATLHGTLMLDHDRATIDRLWNRFVAAWFEGGKDDPKLALLRFEPSEAEIWQNDSSFLAGVKLLLGADPKEEYRDKVAKVRMR